MEEIINRIRKKDCGIKEIALAGDLIIAKTFLTNQPFPESLFNDGNYRIRILMTYIIGRLSPLYPQTLEMLRTIFPSDENWRVQQMSNYECLQRVSRTSTLSLLRPSRTDALEVWFRNALCFLSNNLICKGKSTNVKL